MSELENKLNSEDIWSLYDDLLKDSNVIEKDKKEKKKKKGN